MIRNVIKEYKPDFLNFDKSEQRLDEFLTTFPDAPSFSDLRKVFKILLILSHGQAQVDWGFRINKQLLLENLYPSSLVAENIVKNHKVFHKLWPNKIDITAKMDSHAWQPCTSTLIYQRVHSLKKLQFETDVKMQVLNDDIDDVN